MREGKVSGFRFSVEINVGLPKLLKGASAHIRYMYVCIHRVHPQSAMSDAEANLSVVYATEQ